MGKQTLEDYLLSVNKYFDKVSVKSGDTIIFENEPVSDILKRIGSDTKNAIVSGFQFSYGSNLEKLLIYIDKNVSDNQYMSLNGKKGKVVW